MDETRHPPAIRIDGTVARLTGAWTQDHAGALDDLDRMALEGATLADASLIDSIDTMGCLALARAEERLGPGGAVTGLSPAAVELFQIVRAHHGDVLPADPRFSLHRLVEKIGQTAINATRDVAEYLSFLGAVILLMGKGLFRPHRWRINALVTQVDRSAFRAVPIILLINFVIGGIIAQQSAFQLRAFGAEVFVVDLIGILVLREIGVLIASIMVAGRTGSSYTAEIGSMKMREEVDALHVLGLDAMAVLVMPRIVGLMIALPLLTFLADMAAIGGGMTVGWLYSGIQPAVFIDRMHEAILLETVMVGFIKAPFMALIIGIIACLEGLRVQGSAESLGTQVTTSVVKAIFMVIVLDGLFAMFFASIDY